MNASKEEKKARKKSLSVFVHDYKTKEDDKIVLQRVGFEISRERQGYYYNQEEWLKDDKAPEKPLKPPQNRV